MTTTRRLPLSFDIDAAKAELEAGDTAALIRRAAGSHNLYVTRIWANAMTMRHDADLCGGRLARKAAESIRSLLW